MHVHSQLFFIRVSRLISPRFSDKEGKCTYYTRSYQNGSIIEMTFSVSIPSEPLFLYVRSRKGGKSEDNRRRPSILILPPIMSRNAPPISPSPSFPSPLAIRSLLSTFREAPNIFATFTIRVFSGSLLVGLSFSGAIFFRSRLCFTGNLAP